MAGTNPMTVFLGVSDKSTEATPALVPSVPKHCPKVWIYAPKGRLESKFYPPDALSSIYGAGAFDNTGKFYTHANHALASCFMANGNAVEVQRVIPPDAGVKANFTVWLDVLKTNVPNYQRNSDGSYLTDVNGRPQKVVGNTTTSGYIIKVVVTSVTVGNPTMADSTLFGNKTPMVGDQTDGTNTSTRYPIMEFWGDSYGSYYNNAGFKLIAPTTSSTNQPLTSLMNTIGVFMYRLIAMRRDTATSTPYQVNTVNGDTYIDFALKAGQVNPLTGGNPISIGDTFAKAFTNETTGYTPVYGDYTNIKVYTANVNTVAALLYASEYDAALANGFVGSDLTQNPALDETHKINLLTAVSTGNIPYYSILSNTSDSNAVTLSESNTIYGAGGSDGSVASATGGQYFDSLVAEKLGNYADPNSKESNMLKSPGNVFYDTGFALTTKYAFNQVHTNRKDVYVYASTYTVGGATMTNTDEFAIAAALASRIRLYPESSVFGTPAFRASIMGRHATDVNTPFVAGYQVPATLFWVARKNAMLMGASSGIYNATYLYDNGEDDANVINDFINWNVSFTGATTAASAWAACLNVPLPRDTSRQFMPLVRTVYSDETSVLLSNINAHICAQLETIGYNNWATFSGSIRYTPAQFVAEVEAYCTPFVASSNFANLLLATPVCTITGSDAAAGYRWKLVFIVGLNNPLYQQTLELDVYRQSNMPTTTS